MTEKLYEVDSYVQNFTAQVVSCTPVPGDPVVGFITRGYGVSVHRADCPNASEEKRKEQPDRWIHVSWGTDTNDSYPTTIEAVCKDRLNLLLDISAALSTTKTFVLGLNSRSTEDGFAIIRIEIQIKDGAQLSTLMNKLHHLRRSAGQPACGLIFRGIGNGFSPLPQRTALDKMQNTRICPVCGQGPLRSIPFRILNKELLPCVLLLHESKTPLLSSMNRSTVRSAPVFWCCWV